MTERIYSGDIWTVTLYKTGADFSSSGGGSAGIPCEVTEKVDAVGVARGLYEASFPPISAGRYNVAVTVNGGELHVIATVDIAE